jgi:iron complex outermembrane receptor protein
MNRCSKRHIGALSLLASGLVNVAIAADAQVEQLDTVIVTGTREAGRKARASATPIDVIQAEDLAATGQTSLLDALKNVLPSVNTPAVGYDVGALARTFQLRGLSPGHTLVLINGKRRHLSASLYADSDPAQGSNAVDLDLIPLSAIDHVEILRDGAAAQYGSDAIAGVINVILKKSADGTNVSVLGGGYRDGGGATGQVDLDRGFELGADGALHVSAGYRQHDFSNRSGDSGGPESAKVQGDPKSDLASLGFNLEKPLGGDLSTYAFGTVARRNAKAYENPRQPSTAGGWLDPIVDTVYPHGFTPQEKVEENDFGLTAGIKSTAAGQWNWDLSTTYGRDDAKLRNIKTINPDLLIDRGNAQSDFNVGSFTSSELTTNLDLRRPFTVSGLAGPLNVAVGLEDRYETFKISAGEPNSYYGGGPQAFPGFRVSDRADVNRNSVAAYADLSAHISPAWELGFAARAEHYEQVGNKQTGKLTSRYDFSPQLGVRGTLSNGFHAPTLAQQYYSATTVTTGFAQIQLPLGSAGAKVLGAPDLKPETSRNFSLGFVAEPVKGVHASVDAYQIDIDNRIIQSASLSGSTVAAAIAANGSVIPAGVPGSNVSAAFFTNGVDTRTRGLDLSLDFRTDLDRFGLIKWLINGGYNKTTISRIHDAPAALQAAGLSLVDVVQSSNLTTATPHTKLSLAATYFKDAWDVTLRETLYGKSSQVQGYAPGPYFTYDTDAAYITDLDIGYNFSEHLKLDVGASNLFNVYPNKVPASVYQSLNYDQYSHVSPYGINGGYYYVKLSAAF